MSGWTIVNCVPAGDAKKTSGNDIRTTQPTGSGKESVHAWFLFALQTKTTDFMLTLELVDL